MHQYSCIQRQQDGDIEEHCYLDQCCWGVNLDRYECKEEDQHLLTILNWV